MNTIRAKSRLENDTLLMDEGNEGLESEQAGEFFLPFVTSILNIQMGFGVVLWQFHFCA